MNAPTFDGYSSTCPVCRRTVLLKSGQLWTGLLICKHCQERVVVSWSGHYVRDPFRLRQLQVERTLRRESHPLFRILRDLNLTRSNVINVGIVILAGTLLLGVFSVLSGRLFPDRTKSSPPSLSQQSPPRSSF